MSDRPKRAPLGRGLAALFGEGGARVIAGPGTPRAVPIEAIRPSPFQPRRRFAEAERFILSEERSWLRPVTAA